MLIKGEELNFTVPDSDDVPERSDSAINEKYVKGEIRIVTEQARYPLDTISSKIVVNEKYKLNPEYQRRHRWDNVKKSRLIESLIINVPIPPIFLYEYDYSKYEVMDGLQRLTAIHEFYTNQFELEGLEQWPELIGRTYSTLPEKIREGIDRRYLSSFILLKETAKSDEEATNLKQLVFERLNSGGVELAPQESRNALYNGPMNKLCLKLSLNEELCKLWGIPEPSEEELNGGSPSSERIENDMFREMGDVELVLRFFAYRQKHKLHKGTNLARYLDSYLRASNNFDERTLQGLERLFLETIRLVYQTFEEKAFWLRRQKRKPTDTDKWNWRERATTTVYDPMMYVFSKYLKDKKLILRKKDILRKEVVTFYETNYDDFGGRNVNPSVLKKRDALFEQFLTKQLGI